WSSQGLVDMFDDLDGSMKEKQLLILPMIDEKLSKQDSKLNRFQYHFLRDVTLHAVYPKTRVEFSIDDIQWLLDKFDRQATQQRAALIIMLLKLNFKELDKQKRQKIKDLLVGTLAEINSID
ncbi:MAG: hypothetical protein AAFQ94_30575, partial [Bacteroidota bacterium]